MEAVPTRLSSAIWSKVSTTRDSDPHLAVACGAFRGRLRESNPSAGLDGMAIGETVVPGTLFHVSDGSGLLASPLESYLRGNDFVSTYPATDAFPFRTQLYWSAQMLEVGGIALTLTISMQTDLLDTCPELSLVTEVDQAEASRWGSEATQLRTKAGPLVVLAPHPSDASEFSQEVTTNGARLRFASPFLEKGVIRRCRAAAIFFPGSAEKPAVGAAIAEFAALPLPLTT